MVIEITAGDICPSDVFATGYSLRFARIIRVRPDKKYNESLDVAGLNTVINNFNAGIRKEKLPVDEELAKRKRGTSKRAYERQSGNMLAQFKPTDVTNIEEESIIFKDLSFCVLNFDSSIADKEILEKMIVGMAGKCIQSAVKG